MSPDWQHIIQRLDKYHKKIHRLLPPCPEERIETIQRELGAMPNELVGMLKHFNGAELFLKNGPFVSIFGISTIPLLQPSQWAVDWYIDKFTQIWRSNAVNRQTEWAIAMMNYGGLIILEHNGTIKEWDTSQGRWTPENWEFSEWLEVILNDGDLYMRQ